jgi:hypothetical protein
VPDQQTQHTWDPRHQALRRALLRQRDLLHELTIENDAAIAAWDALDDDRLEIARRGVAQARAALQGARR